jgi:hypothetical protein
MEDSRTRLIGRAVDAVLHRDRSPLPEFTSLTGSSELLASLLYSTTFLERNRPIHVEGLVQAGDVQGLIEFLEQDSPALLVECVDFYFSRTAIRMALGFQAYPIEKAQLAYWEGP